MSTAPLVRIVHCVDTEGPLDETLDATFERIRSVFGLEFDPSEETLERLRRGEGIPSDLRAPMARLLDPHNFAYLRDWSALEAMLDRAASPENRLALPDRTGSGWVFSWFCLDHVGYERNPRRRDLGHHKVWDRYVARLRMDGWGRDVVQFHYHPLPWNRMAHSCATSYLHSPHLPEILGRKILERSWFPCVFRPGFHAVRPDSHWFLDQWFPYDYSNQSTDEDVDQPDLASGRFGDWRGAPTTWRGYHPDVRDWRAEGACRRATFRCLNLESRLRRLERRHVEEAFQEAESTGSAVLAFTSHDFRDLEPEMRGFRAMLASVAAEHPSVEFEYVDALAAARAQRGDLPRACGLELSLRTRGDEAVLSARVGAEPFGPQPFLAIETADGRILHDNLDFGDGPASWRYVFDWQTVSVSEVRRIGIAATSRQGVVDLAVLDGNGALVAKEVLHG